MPESNTKMRLTVICAALGMAVLFVLAIGCSSNRDNPTLPVTHPDEWLDRTSDDFHASVVFSMGVEGCKECHGSDLDGGRVGVSCVDCHESLGGFCTACHGGYANSTGAPPYGLRGETDDTTIAVGAHTIHIEGSTLAAAVKCSDCHNVPLFVFDSLHYDNNSLAGGYATDSIAEIVWHGFADGGNASWNRDTRACSGTYCHGAFSGGNANNAPVWTAKTQAHCGSCHDIGYSPEDLLWKHEYHIQTGDLACADCHANVVDASLTIVAPELHVNGIIDTMIADTTLCAECHAASPEACTRCHGGSDNITGAPPLGLRGETSTTQLAVGAHTRHMQGGAYADAFSCSDCHLVPNSLTAPGHLGADSVAELSWSTLAGGQSTWNRNTAKCSLTYCHGNFSGGYTANAPIWTVTGQAECGSCHDNGTSPSNLSGRHRKHIVDENVACMTCHFNTVNIQKDIIGRGAHVDGTKTVSFSFQGSYNNGTCSGLPGQCHGSENWFSD